MLFRGGIFCGLECCSSYCAGDGELDFGLNNRAFLKSCLSVSEKCISGINNNWNCEIGDDDDSCSESDWSEDEWPIEHPLPLPEWGYERPELQFVALDVYENFLSLAIDCLRECLETHCYDTFSNFLTFGLKYQACRQEYFNLRDFYRDYDPPILPGRYTCVGLSLDLSSRLSQLELLYPGIQNAMYQVSVEEEKKEMESEVETPPAKLCVIEHVMVCIKILVSGRPGVLLFDPGYHVSQPITIMKDGLSPHTGAIKGSTTRDDVTRMYRYRYSTENPSLIAWTVEEKRAGSSKKEFLNIIHPSKPFLSGVDIAERRNLVYPFKTLLERDCYGRLISGLYFPVRETSQTLVTFFYRRDGLPCQKKVPLAHLVSETSGDDEEVETAMRAVAKGTGRSLGEFHKELVTLAHLLKDIEFVSELLLLEEEITNIG